MRQQQFHRYRDKKQRICPWGMSCFTAIMAVAAAAACIFQVEAFSTSLLHNQDRIRRSTRSVAPAIGGSAIKLSHGDALRLFGDARHSPARLWMAKSDYSVSDQADWKALLTALQLFKAAYGNLKVPKLFVVPSMAPWPGEFYSVFLFLRRLS
jgi:hypothetical protein